MFPVAAAHFPHRPAGKSLRLVTTAMTMVLAHSHLAHAEIIGLYSTGVNDDGAVLAAGTVDPHYTALSVPSGAGTEVLAQSTPGFWSAPPSGSSWVSVVESGGIAIPGGDYVFATQFTIQNVDPGLVVLTGSMLVDNSVEIYVNGQSTGVGIPFGNNSHQVATDFTLNSANSNFITGTNQLELRWNNFGSGVSAGGIALAISGSVVPEPSALALWGVASLAAIIQHRRRRHRTVA